MQEAGAHGVCHCLQSQEELLLGHELGDDDVAPLLQVRSSGGEHDVSRCRARRDRLLLPATQRATDRVDVQDHREWPVLDPTPRQRGLPAAGKPVQQ